MEVLPGFGEPVSGGERMKLQAFRVRVCGCPTVLASWTPVPELETAQQLSVDAGAPEGHSHAPRFASLFQGDVFP